MATNRTRDTRQITKATLDGVRTIPELVSRIAPFFLSSSMAQPPGASLSNTGNRTVVLTNKNTTIPTVAPSDSTTIKLVAGSLTWTYTTKFNQQPIVTWGVEGSPPSAGTTLYISAVSNASVTVKSTDGTDTRTVHLNAVLNAT